ncbi:MAG: hypothetical protein PHI28_08465 [Mangrovibacterium sp.]|nr:hypothetical protein [Mangrovibacterium sp.]
MKKIVVLMFALFAFAACGPHMYSTRSAGQDNSSFVVVVTNGQKYENVAVIVDGTSHPVEKVYKLKAIRKAHPVAITPGKHQIQVVSGDKILSDENIFLGLQETKKIVLP